MREGAYPCSESLLGISGNTLRILHERNRNQIADLVVLIRGERRVEIAKQGVKRRDFLVSGARKLRRVSRHVTEQHVRQQPIVVGHVLPSQLVNRRITDPRATPRTRLLLSELTWPDYRRVPRQFLPQPTLLRLDQVAIGI